MVDFYIPGIVRVEERLDGVRQCYSRLVRSAPEIVAGPAVGEAVGQLDVGERQHLLRLRHLVDLQEVLHDGGGGIRHLAQEHRHAGGLGGPCVCLGTMTQGLRSNELIFVIGGALQYLY